jgi:NADH-quinone oxidoreductase subunit I
MNCGICEEACPFEAIYMDHEFEIASPTRNQTLLYHRDDLLKSNEYFHKIRPNDADVVDKKLAEAAAKKKAAEEAAKAAAAAKAAQAAQTPPPQPPAPPQNPPAPN